VGRLLVILYAASAGRIRAGVTRAGVSALVLAPWVAFNLATVGRVVPATAAAKVRAGVVGALEGTGFVWDDLAFRVTGFTLQWAALLLEDHVALPFLVAAGIVALRRVGP
jgi:hypothetical protein